MEIELLKLNLCFMFHKTVLIRTSEVLPSVRPASRVWTSTSPRPAMLSQYSTVTHSEDTELTSSSNTQMSVGGIVTIFILINYS